MPSILTSTTATQGQPGATLQTGRRSLPVETDFYIAPGTGGHGKARVDGLHAVIGAFGCGVAVFGYDTSRADKFLVMVGTRPVLDALEVLLPQVARQMEQAARVAARSYVRGLRDALPNMGRAERSYTQAGPYFRDYLRGFGCGVADQLTGIRAEAMHDGDHELGRVLRETRTRVEEALDRDFPQQRHMPAPCREHPEARSAGLVAGRSASIGDRYLAIHDLVFALL